MDQQVDLSTIPISPSGEGAGDSTKDSEGKVVTVFHDKENFNVKHQLQNKWTLWFTKPPSGKVSLPLMHIILNFLGFTANTLSGRELERSAEESHRV